MLNFYNRIILKAIDMPIRIWIVEANVPLPARFILTNGSVKVIDREEAP